MSAAKRGYERRASFGDATATKADGPEGPKGTILIPVVTEADAAAKVKRANAKADKNKFKPRPA